MGMERDALLLDLPQSGQGKHLESSAVRQDRPRPGHKPVQSAKAPDQRVSGADMQVISI